MSKNSRDDHFFIYPRTKEGQPTGHVYCVILREGQMFEGSSLCSPKDQFVKATGRKLAYERAMAEYERNKKYKNKKKIKKKELLKLAFNSLKQLME